MGNTDLKYSVIDNINTHLAPPSVSACASQERHSLGTAAKDNTIYIARWIKIMLPTRPRHIKKFSTPPLHSSVSSLLSRTDPFKMLFLKRLLGSTPHVSVSFPKSPSLRFEIRFETRCVRSSPIGRMKSGGRGGTRANENERTSHRDVLSRHAGTGRVGVVTRCNGIYRSSTSGRDERRHGVVFATYV